MLNAIDGVSCAEPEGAFTATRTCRAVGSAPRGASGALLHGTSPRFSSNRIKIAVVPAKPLARPGYFRLSSR